MIMLRNYIIKENMKFIFILKFFTLILLIWICYLKSDKIIFGRHIESEYKVEKTSFESFNRLLAKHVIQEELRNHRQSEFLSDNIMNKNMKNVLEYTSTDGQLNKKRRNNLDSYKKGYMRRYSKKNGLGKLECYYEKKVFDKIDDLYKLVEKLKNDKKLSKKKLWHKFGIRYFLFSLIPVFGLVVPLVDYGYLAKNFHCYDDCTKEDHKEAGGDLNYIHDDSKYKKAPINESTWDAISVVNIVLSCVTAIIILSIITYIWIKFIKYQRLKACKAK